MAHIIKPDGTIEEIKPSSGQQFSLEELQQAVGGYLELVRMGKPVNISGVKYLQCFVNEDGKRMKLDFNVEATELWRDSWNRLPHYMADHLLGNVMFFTDKEVD
jgi:hypothetical protein